MAFPCIRLFTRQKNTLPHVATQPVYLYVYAANLKLVSV